MSTLLVDELFDGVTAKQTIRISRNLSVKSIRAWIYKQGTLPAGTFELSILDGVNLLGTSSILSTDINSNISSTYAHGFIDFSFDNLILNIPETEEKKEYNLEFTFNAAFDGSNFIGLVRRWEAKTYPTYGDGVVGGEAPNDSTEPYGLEIYEYTTRK